MPNGKQKDIDVAKKVVRIYLGIESIEVNIFNAVRCVKHEVKIAIR